MSTSKDVLAKTKGVKSSKCVTIKRVDGGQLQQFFAKCGYQPHVIYCKIWRWPEILNYYDLKRVEDCQFGFNINVDFRMARGNLN